MAQPSHTGQVAVFTAEELIAATQNKEVTEISVSADLADLPPLTLMPAQTLRSASDRHAVLSFRPEADGLQVTTDNSVVGLDLRVTPTHRAIWNDRAVKGLGTLAVQSVRAIGSVQIIVSDEVRSGRIESMVWIFSPQTREVSVSARTSTVYLFFRGLLLSGISSLMNRW